VKEQSHKSEMRAALRGDFERLQARRQETVEPVLAPLEPDGQQQPPVVAEARPPRSSWLDRLRDRR
jgi:hypothetical protein